MGKKIETLASKKKKKILTLTSKEKKIETLTPKRKKLKLNAATST